MTGANRGLGKAFTEALLAAGAAKIYAGARDPYSSTGTVDRIVPVKLDVTKREQVDAVAKACCDVNLLINNAGILKRSSMLAEGSEVAFRAEMEVNVFGTLSMVRAFAPVLAKNGGGAIANILSVASWIAFPKFSNATYAASKHAAKALTDAVRFQLKAQGTQVVGVFSGYIDTDMAAGVDLPKVSPLQVVSRTLAGIQEFQDQVYADERTEETWNAKMIQQDFMLEFKRCGTRVASTSTSKSDAQLRITANESNDISGIHRIPGPHHRWRAGNILDEASGNKVRQYGGRGRFGQKPVTSTACVVKAIHQR